ncbi:hypothetical protein ACQVTU_24390, partial [Bacillus cereus]
RKRMFLFHIDSFSYRSVFFFMFSNRKHVFGMLFCLTKLSSYLSCLTIVSNFLADIVYAVVDPRIRLK